MNALENMPENARAWVYAANRVLSHDESAHLLNMARNFASGWTAHEQPLKAAVEILHEVFVVFMVDESVNQVSGCGIDKSVALMKQAGESMGLDFFNRLQLEFLTPEGIIITTKAGANEFALSGRIHAETITFNKTISNKSQFDREFTIPFHSSWAYAKKPVNA